MSGDDTVFTDCPNGELWSWMGAPLGYAYDGYTHPGQVEEFWLLDVDGQRLMIVAATSPGSSEGDIAELRSTGLDFNIARVGCTTPRVELHISGDGVKAQFGPTVDDLVTFLAGVQTIKISENTDVTLDGYRGIPRDHDRQHRRLWRRPRLYPGLDR